MYFRSTNLSLNPYFFGKCSTAPFVTKECVMNVVLILIFLENALRPKEGGIQERIEFLVLILIFLENALRLHSS